MSGPGGALVGVLCAVGILAAAEGGLESAALPAWWVLGLCTLPHAAALLARGSPLARARWRAAVAASPVPLYFVAIAACGWRVWANELAGAGGAGLALPGPDVLLSLAPFFVLATAAADASARLAPLPPAGRAALRALGLRALACAAGPILGLVGATTLLGRSERVRLELVGVGLWYALFFVAALAATAVLLPWWLRRVWDCESLPAGPARELLERTAERAGFRYSSLCVWRTGGLLSNALIAGLVPRTRVVLFTDALLARLAPAELRAVFAHEIGHAARGHAPLFGVMTCAWFMASDLIAASVDPAGGSLALGFLGAALLAWAAAFAWVSRRAELEADLFASRLAGEGAMEGAFARLGAGTDPAAEERASWRHFSPARRVSFLERAAAEPAVGEALGRRMRRVWLASLAVFCVAGALEVRGLLSDFPAERCAVALRMGRYERGAQLARGADDLPPDLARLVAVIAADRAELDHPDRSAAAAACAERAGRALAAGRPRAALDWLRLAELAGSAGVVACAEAVRLGSEGRFEAAHAALGGARGELAGEVAAWLARAWGGAQ
ncbi:MAG: M48 family metalloprotease [Planctomycetota bacterium]|jgi:STE24 endopeptidase|nr:M48 family metalloprotease [Planctomycetota bacterium]MDP6762678.1 M48 family metalloprotease [Planctomycetota bacterium]MDP6989987.1 M48 family metalloprotease [Planctomycetota bacterium]